MSEIPWGNFESNENLPTLKQSSPEEVQKVWEDIEYSNHLQKVNDVLNVLAFPDNIEERFRIILDKQDDKTLIELSKQSKQEIQSFLLSERSGEKMSERKEQTKESQIINSQISKIKSTFTPEILSKSPDIEKLINSFNLQKDGETNMKTIDKILNLLKQPWKLKSIINDLWWADKNNQEYVEFRDNLISIDSSFEKYFNDLENISSWVSFDTNDIINWIEKNSWGIVDIDLKSNPPISKMSLIWSSYSFDEKLDKQELSNVMQDNQEELNEVEESFSVLKEFWVSFDTLLNAIQLNWWKENFKDKLKESVNNFSRDIFGNLDDVYKDMGIESKDQIKESDISSFKDINSPNNLKAKIKNIKEKFTTIKWQVWETQAWIYKDYKTEMKELLSRKEKAKEKQLEVLKFMKYSWFDLIPKSITNKIIWELQSNTLAIPWLNLSIQNIDLKNGHFWENSAFIDKDNGLNIQSKTNLVKFMNKLISWDTKEPLSVEWISNWVSIANPAFLKHKFIESGITNNFGWKYSRIVENLKSKP